MENTLEIVCNREWSLLGSDALKLARYWCKRWCVAYGARHTTDMTADCLVRALERYQNWRENNRPRRPVKAIQSFIRGASRRAVIAQFPPKQQRLFATVPDKPELTDGDGTATRLRVALAALPAEVSAAALLCAMGFNMRDAAEQLGISATTFCRRIDEARRSEALSALLVMQMAENGRGIPGAAVACGVSL